MTKTLDLFDYVPPPPPPEKTPRELGHEGAQRAADHAGDDWKAKALGAVVRHAKAHASFTIEEVRAASPEVPPPPEPRAWGQAALAAKRQGIVRAGGLEESINRSRHAGTVRRWHSLIVQNRMRIE